MSTLILPVSSEILWAQGWTSQMNSDLGPELGDPAWVQGLPHCQGASCGHLPARWRARPCRAAHSPQKPAKAPSPASANYAPARAPALLALPSLGRLRHTPCSLPRPPSPPPTSRTSPPSRQPHPPLLSPPAVHLAPPGTDCLSPPDPGQRERGPHLCAPTCAPPQLGPSLSESARGGGSGRQFPHLARKAMGAWERGEEGGRAGPGRQWSRVRLSQGQLERVG